MVKVSVLGEDMGDGRERPVQEQRQIGRVGDEITNKKAKSSMPRRSPIKPLTSPPVISAVAVSFKMAEPHFMPKRTPGMVMTKATEPFLIVDLMTIMIDSCWSGQQDEVGYQNRGRHTYISS